MVKRHPLFAIQGGRQTPPAPRPGRSKWSKLDWGDHALVEDEWRRLGLGPQTIAQLRVIVCQLHRAPHVEVIDGGKEAA